MTIPLPGVKVEKERLFREKKTSDGQRVVWHQQSLQEILQRFWEVYHGYKLDNEIVHLRFSPASMICYKNNFKNRWTCCTNYFIRS